MLLPILDTNCFQDAMFEGVRFKRKYVCTSELEDEMKNSLLRMGKSDSSIARYIKLDRDFINRKKLQLLTMGFISST